MFFSQRYYARASCYFFLVFVLLLFRSFCPHRQFCLSPPGSSLVALVLYIRLISRLSCLLSGALRLLSGVFLLVRFVFDFFHSLTSLQIFLLFPRYCSFRFSLGFYSRFVLFLCRLLPLLYRCCRYRLSRVSDFLPDFPIVFFFKSFRLFTLCPISLVTLIIFLYRLAISSYRFFFVIFHDFFWSFYIQVFSIETMWYFFYRLGFFVTYAHVITALCRRWKIIMSITHVENNNQARYEAIRRVCLWRVQMRVIVHCATFSHNMSN